MRNKNDIVGVGKVIVFDRGELGSEHRKIVFGGD